jgi:hypothetical protein
LTVLYTETVTVRDIKVRFYMHVHL